MGKKTAAVNKERLETIKQHTDWAMQQAPIVEAMAHYAEECMVFAPVAAERSTGQFDHTWAVKQVHILPDFVEEAVTIPANSVRLSLMDDHGVLVCIGRDPLAGAPRRRYVTLDPDLEVIVPGGSVSHVVKTDKGYVVKEPGDG